MDRIIRKILRIRFANRMMTHMEENKSVSWNPREPSMAILWFVTVRLITGFIITMMD